MRTTVSVPVPPSPRFHRRPLPLLIGLITGSMLGVNWPVPAFAEVPVQADTWVTSGAAVAEQAVDTAGQAGLRITQQTGKATLNWKSFNIGAENWVDFRQPGADSVALNRIQQADPSRIMGRLTANGQVYLINQNGILFGRDARVDVNSLVASTLDIDDAIFEDVGIVGALDNDRAAFEAAATMPADAEILVEEGARLDAQAGGRIMILAPRVTNRGDIATPDGQAVLAAAQDKVYITSSSSPDLRGLLVEVETGGTVDNLGSIIAERGNASLLGMAVNQSGRVRATTSVSLNGSIRLVAGDQANTAKLKQNKTRAQLADSAAQRGGTLTLGENSVTEILPEGAGKASDSQEQPDSVVQLVGKTVDLAQGARVTAPSGRVEIVAAGNPDLSSQTTDSDPDAAIRIAAGALIDVSGTDSTRVSVARNVIEVEARGNELADSPRQRDGVVRGETLSVDTRAGTPLLNFSAAAGNLQRDVIERSATGGSVQLDANSGAVSVADGARIDVSGGRVTYAGGSVATSKLVTVDGRILDISEADPDLAYRRVLDPVARYEAGYVEGRDAGELRVSAARIEFDGTLDAGAVSGRYQRAAPADLDALVVRPFDQRPRGGSLDVVLSGAAGLEVGPAASAAGGADLIHLSQELLEAARLSALSITSVGDIRLAPSARPLTLADNGHLALTTQRRILIDNGVRIQGGEVDLTTREGTAIAVDDTGVVLSAGNSIDVSGGWVNDDPLISPDPSAPIAIDGGAIAIATVGDLALEAGSVLDVSGGARLAGGRLFAGAGGSISLVSDASGTDTVTAMHLDGDLRGFALADGGLLSIAANAIRIQPAPGAPSLPGELVLTPTFFTDGGFGRIALTATRTGIDVAADTRIDLKARNRVFDPSAASRPTGVAFDAITHTALLPDYLRNPLDLTLVYDPAFGLVDGIVDLNVGSRAAIVGDVGAQLTLRSDTSLFVDGTLSAPAGRIDLATVKGGIANTFDPAQMIWLGPNARLAADGAVVTRPSDTGLRLGDVLDAGTVSLAAQFGSIVTDPASSISVDGASARFNIPAVTGAALVPVAGNAGTVSLVAAESLLPQGRISGRASAANAAGGTLRIGLDPSARPTEAVENADNIPADQRFPSGPRVLAMADLDQGLVDTLREALRADVEATLRADLRQTNPGIDDATLALLVDERLPALLDAQAQTALATLALPGRGDAVPAVLNGQGYVPVDALTEGGFDALDARVVAAGNATGPDLATSLAVLRFPVDLDLALARRISLDAPLLAAADAGGETAVRLAAPYVAIGSTSPYNLDGALPNGGGASVVLAPTIGAGRLDVHGGLIDLVGEAVLQGFGGGATPGIAFTSDGDIRLRGVSRAQSSFDYSGSLRAADDLTFTADRIYPTTLSRYTIRVEGDDQATVRFAGAGAAGTPLSAGGALRIEAPNIVSAGALYAPLGALDLVATARLVLADGSLLSTSAAGLRMPFGQTQFGTDLILARGTSTFAFSADPTQDFEVPLPEKRIGLAAPDVAYEAGALVDETGGGDLRAFEFVPGPGGSRDILLADLDTGAGVEANPSFAIVPGLNSLYAPVDPIEWEAANAVQGLRVGDTLVLEEGLAGLPAGEYALLPARYALYGGYLVTPVADTADLGVGQNLARADGAPIVAGRYGVAGTGIHASRTSGFAVENGQRVRARSEYVETSLDALFGAQGAVRPLDAGTLVIEAGRSLSLLGRLLPNGTDGLGTRLDIAADELAVVDTLSGARSGVELLAGDLSALGADSLLIGGVRRTVGGETLIETRAASVTVTPGVSLDADELLLSGNQVRIEGEAGAPTSIRSSATAVATRAETLVVDDDSALVAVTRNGDLSVRRAGAGTPSAAALTVTDAVSLAARGAIVLDSSGDATLAGAVDADGGTLALGARTINLGETGGRALDGLVLSNAELAALAGGNLLLRSRDAINFIGAVADPVAGGALTFSQLTLDSASLRGLEQADVQLGAARVDLLNTSGVQVRDTLNDEGTLRLDTGRLALGDGDLFVTGFRDVVVAAGENITATGVGAVEVSGNLALSTPVIAATSGAGATFAAAAGDLTVTGGERPFALPVDAGPGGSLTLAADRLSFAGRAVLPSGSVVLRQTGAAELSVGDAAVIDVAGRDETFADLTIGAPGGDVELRADAGSLAIGAARIDVSAAPAGGSAGELRLIAPAGRVALAQDADLRATGDAGGGSLVIDAAVLAGTDAALDMTLGALHALLGEGQFGAARAIRVRDQDLVLNAGELFAAHRIQASSDRGSLLLAGTLDAGGDDGGDILLAAGDRLRIDGRLDASAQAADGSGGRVVLTARDADGDDAAGATDAVAFNAGALIDVSGGARGEGGSLTLETRRLDRDGDGVGESVVAGTLAGEVRGARATELVATRTVADPGFDPGTGVSTIAAAQQAQWLAEMQAFMAAPVGAPAGAWRLVPGLEVNASGDLVLADAWDLVDWRFAGTAPALALRAAGALRIAGDLGDGFRTDAFNPLHAFFDMEYARLQPGDTTDLRLVGGADLTGADPLAVARSGVGDLSVAAGKHVRTGTGSIDLAAAGDVELEAGAAVYTAGADAGFGQLETLSSDPAFGRDVLLFLLNVGQYGENGGDIRVTAGGDLRALGTPVLSSVWQPKVVGPVINDLFGDLPPYWAVAHDRFVNGIGTLGGGDIDVRVGGDVRNVTLAAPTSGKAVDGIALDTNFQDVFRFQSATETVRVSGGGDVRVRAGGDFAGGLLHVGAGSADLDVKGAVGAGDTGLNPVVLAGGDSALRVRALRDLTLTTVMDTLALPASAAQVALAGALGSLDSVFFSLTPEARVDVATLTGDVRFVNAIDDVEALADRDLGKAAFLSRVYPAGLRAVSYRGDIEFGDSLTLLPGANAELTLLAGGDILGRADSELLQSDTSRAFLPGVDAPITSDANPPPNSGESNTPYDQLSTRLEILGGGIAQPELFAAVPNRLGDDGVNLIVARDGGIHTDTRSQEPNPWSLWLARASRVAAGGSIENLTVRIQNLDAGDLSEIAAGADIVQTAIRRADGGFVDDDQRVLQIAGPGRLDVIAGGDIDLGTSRGILSVGDTVNPALADTGASVTLLAGAAGEPDYEGFTRRYLIDSTLYRDRLAAFMHDLGLPEQGNLALLAFQTLPQNRRRELLLAIFFAELREAGVEATGSGSQDYSRGFDAVATLFPDAGGWDGDILMPVSVIKTEDGGDIDLLTPGGSINAGATSPLIAKQASDLGVITGTGGDINAFLDRDFLVNINRVFALRGDLLAWSSNGSIDAGKGAKTAASVPPPVTTTDDRGNTVVVFPPAVEGSGLQGVNAFLFAPRGVIDAGDAGIRAQGNLTVGATEILGADNIDVGGISVGVPSTSGDIGGDIAGGDVAASATKLAEESTGSIGGDADRGPTNRFGVLLVELLGLEGGDCTGEDSRNCNDRAR